MNVNEVAAAMGVTPRRVRALISAGKMPAHRSSGRWVVAELPTSRSRRPLSLRSRAQLANTVHYRTLSGLTGQELSRTAARLGLLRTSEDPARILLDWWGGVADESDTFVRNLLQRAIAGDAAGVREELRRRPQAYLSTSERLAARITMERRIQGLSAAELAEKAGVDRTVVVDLERGRPTSSPGPLRRVLRALDVVPSALPPMVGAS